jgi:hypothetical protein
MKREGTQDVYKPPVRKTRRDLGMSSADYLRAKRFCRDPKNFLVVRSLVKKVDDRAAPWILTGITHGLTYEYVEFGTKLGRIPICRTDYYNTVRLVYSLILDGERK